MKIISVDEKVGFSPEFMPRILRVRPDYKVPLICMEPGQQIQPHRGGAGVFFFMSGSGFMTVEGKDYAVKPGTMVFIEKGEERGIKAAEKLTAFAVHFTPQQ